MVPESPDFNTMPSLGEHPNQKVFWQISLANLHQPMFSAALISGEQPAKGRSLLSGGGKFCMMIGVSFLKETLHTVFTESYFI